MYPPLLVGFAHHSSVVVRLDHCIPRTSIRLAQRSTGGLPWNPSGMRARTPISAVSAGGQICEQPGHMLGVGKERRVTGWPFHDRSAPLTQHPLEIWMDSEIVGANAVGGRLCPPGDPRRRLLQTAQRMGPQAIERPRHGVSIAAVVEAPGGNLGSRLTVSSDATMNPSPRLGRPCQSIPAAAASSVAVSMQDSPASRTRAAMKTRRST